MANPIETIEKSFEALKNENNFFVSEADFQHKFGIKLQENFGKDAKIIMEFPVQIKNENDQIENKTIYVDIMVSINGMLYPIELKYKTKKINSETTFEDSGIAISKILKNQGAQDLGRYHFLKDVNRIETLIKQYDNVNAGICIFITNDTSYWNDKENGLARNFKTTGEIKSQGKSLDWDRTTREIPTTNDWTKKYPPIEIENKYCFEWKPFFKFEYEKNKKNTEFNALFIQVG